MEWISVKARLPEQDMRVLVCCKTQKGIRSINLAYQVNGFWHGSGSMSGVTHWMRLPELPKEKDSKAKNKQFLLQAKCEDGENIHIVTEWDKMEVGNVIGVFAALGAKIANDIAGTGGTQAVYKEFERIFRKMQDKETEAELRGMIEEEQKCI